MSIALDRAFPSPSAVKVPARITAWFWLAKILTTAAGEATSDALAHGGNIVGGGAEALLLVVGLAWQFRTRRYNAVAYWFLAYAVATTGTGIADALHLDIHIPYSGTTVLWAVVLAGVFLLWYRSEGTLDIHTVTTRRREVFYWSTVFSTFALGTALGDLTATTLGLGYMTSAVLFSVVILVPAVLWRWMRLDAVAAFWAAYVVTRPLGASYADYIDKPRPLSGIGFGNAPTAALLTLAVAVVVVWLAVSRTDRTGAHARGRAGGRPTVGTLRRVGTAVAVPAAGPVGPRRPVERNGPVRPVGPVRPGPVGGSGHVRPVGPVRRVPPAGPLRPGPSSGAGAARNAVGPLRPMRPPGATGGGDPPSET